MLRMVPLPCATSRSCHDLAGPARRPAPFLPVEAGSIGRLGNRGAQVARLALLRSPLAHPTVQVVLRWPPTLASASRVAGFCEDSMWSYVLRACGRSRCLASAGIGFAAVSVVGAQPTPLRADVPTWSSTNFSQPRISAPGQLFESIPPRSSGITLTHEF